MPNQKTQHLIDSSNPNLGKFYFKRLDIRCVSQDLLKAQEVRHLLREKDQVQWEVAWKNMTLLHREGSLGVQDSMQSDDSTAQLQVASFIERTRRMWSRKGIWSMWMNQWYIKLASIAEVNHCYIELVHGNPHEGNENRPLSVTSQRLDIEPMHGIVWGNHQTSTYSSLWWPCESDATPHETLLAWGLHWTATMILSWILLWERNKCIKKNALCSKETLLDECLYITDVGFKGSVELQENSLEKRGGLMVWNLGCYNIKHPWSRGELRASTTTNYLVFPPYNLFLFYLIGVWFFSLRTNTFNFNAIRNISNKMLNSRYSQILN